MKKINAHSGSIKWNNSVYNPELIIHFRRKEDADQWYEFHMKLTPDIVRDISLALKKYIAAWWQCQQKTLESIQEHIKF